MQGAGRVDEARKNLEASSSDAPVGRARRRRRTGGEEVRVRDRRWFSVSGVILVRMGIPFLT